LALCGGGVLVVVGIVVLVVVVATVVVVGGDVVVVVGGRVVAGGAVVTAVVPGPTPIATTLAVVFTVADPRLGASPKLKSVPFFSTSQYPLPSGVTAMPTIALGSFLEPVEP
jgi:hypothetical protein